MLLRCGRKDRTRFDDEVMRFGLSSFVDKLLLQALELREVGCAWFRGDTGFVLRDEHSHADEVCLIAIADVPLDGVSLPFHGRTQHGEVDAFGEFSICEVFYEVAVDHKRIDAGLEALVTVSG